MLKIFTDAGIEWERDCPLAPYSTFRVGGRAKFLLIPDTAQKLTEALHRLKSAGIPAILIGNGSNVVFPDEGIDGAVILTKKIRSAVRSENCIRAGAGASLSSIASLAGEEGLSGAEFLYGIPGTVGGAVFMNAGAFGGSMDQICVLSEYYDLSTGEVGTFSFDKQEFGVRTSIYEKNPHYAILGAVLELHPGEQSEINRKMGEFLTRRRETQPLEFPSAGSVFKRPEGHFAGKLIEDCGLKGVSVGGAEVSQKHAGFIINRGGATASDIRRLVELIREKVRSETGVTLECEIRFL